MKKYVVSVADMTPEQSSAFTNYCRSQGLSWWHWVGDLWLIIDRKGASNSTIIRDHLRTITDDNNIIVLPVEASGHWAGYGPNDEKKNMFKWLKKNWSNQ